MFKRFRYRLALQAALRELGIDKARLNPALFDEVLATGLREGLAPREAALEILPVAFPAMDLIDRLSALAVIRRWRRKSRVREAHYQRALAGGLPDLQSTSFQDP
ncbi:MAG: hypothetical protein QUV35_18040 [Hydrogenophaga sp.]|uniref:hypothetical protein n=1 Tax=Hydrogenophaga sp. TaxID=1904254 RepID=UPI0026373550|nr:hypothetical protein [Hydrogenophaga sp.]MDM7944527.1 hypothetical protein [Hydrogenophaga sp.]